MEENRRREAAQFGIGEPGASATGGKWIACRMDFSLRRAQFSLVGEVERQGRKVPEDNGALA